MNNKAVFPCGFTVEYPLAGSVHWRVSVIIKPPHGITLLSCSSILYHDITDSCQRYKSISIIMSKPYGLDIVNQAPEVSRSDRLIGCTNTAHSANL